MNLHLSQEEAFKAASYWNAIPFSRMEGTNHVFYEVMIGPTPHIMRLTLQSHREFSFVLAELRWMEFLEGKINLPRVIKAGGGRRAIVLKIRGHHIIACMFEKVGRHSFENEDWGPEAFFEWGSVMNTLHHYSRQYEPKSYPRKLDGKLLLRLTAEVMGEESLAYKTAEKAWSRIAGTMHQKQHWGMIHCDLTPANMHFAANQLYVFDFDNCQYAPFLYDVAVTLYVTLFRMWENPGFSRDAGVFSEFFFKGYLTSGYEPVDMDMLRHMLDFFNVMICVCCRQKEGHPFTAYAQHNLRHGTLREIRLEDYLMKLPKMNI